MRTARAVRRGRSWPEVGRDSFYCISPDFVIPAKAGIHLLPRRRNGCPLSRARRRKKRDRSSVARERRLAEILELREHFGRREITADLRAVFREDRRRAVDADLLAELVLVGDGVV